MRKWGIVITVFYSVILLVFLVPGAVFIVKGNLLDTYTSWLAWIPIGIVIAGQALLLFLSVDTSFQRTKPRAHILVSCLTTGTLWALLTGAAILSLGYGIYGDNFGGRFLDEYVLVCWGVLWLIWMAVFYLYFKKSSALITRVTSWLLKGSILELLIAVPSHVLTRRRHDCSAPVATSFGIATGIAIMLLCFGPSVLLLYKKRMDEYRNRRPATQ